MHTYILGQSGTGKSTLLRQFALEHIAAGAGVFYIDPHGHDIDTLLQYIPKRRRPDVILFDPSREEVVGFNPLQSDSALSISILADAIKEAWGYGDVPTPQMDMYLFFSLKALAEGKRTLADLPRFLTDKPFRTNCLLHVSDSVIKDFWAGFDKYTTKEQRAEVSSTLNKAYSLIMDTRVKDTLGCPLPSFEIADVVQGKILFARLPQGQLSKGRVSVLASILLSLVHQACLARTSNTPFAIFIDECHLLAPSIVKEMLSGIRKFGVSLYLSHQYIDQLDRDYYAAIIGNSATQIVFRTSQDDAKRLVDRMGRGKTDLFTDLPDLRYRYFPLSTNFVYRLEPISKPPYKRSWPDIAENHRRNLWR